MLIFVEGEKHKNPEENPRSEDENKQQTQPTCDAGSGTRTLATVVGGEYTHHCAIPTALAQQFIGNIINWYSVKDENQSNTLASHKRHAKSSEPIKS